MMEPVNMAQADFAPAVEQSSTKDLSWVIHSI